MPTLRRRAGHSDGPMLLGLSLRRMLDQHAAQERACVRISRQGQQPLTLAGIELVVLALDDISDQKRRGVLEQNFLHDARNLLSGIVAWTDILQEDRSDEATTSLRTLVLQLRDLLSGQVVLPRPKRASWRSPRALSTSARSRACWTRAFPITRAAKEKTSWSDFPPRLPLSFRTRTS